MRSIHIGVLSALLLIAGQDQSADVAELLRLETVWNHAHVKGDADALDRLCADDLVVAVQGMPVMSKKESLGILRSGRMRFDKYETSDVQARVYGDAAVVNGQLQRLRRMGDLIAEDNWFFTKVYVRHDGRWHVVSWHASDVRR